MEETFAKIRKLEGKIEAKRDGGSAMQEASERLAVQGDSQEENVTQVMMHEQNIESDGERSVQNADKQSEVAVAGGDSQLISHNLSGIAATSQDKVEVPDKPAEEQFVLDEERIKLLGDDPAANKQAELKLDADVASRVTNWTVMALPKELKESLLSMLT
ncbi:uncharacterized protein LOC143372327 [Andrena cerasifolii]|uniref:uncharacterized protein LOC143372327 n=1 Tax=Andrena cerasifolii TaxID=2819439 RepID=UPI004037A2EC